MSKHALTIDQEFRSLCPTQTKEELEHLDNSLKDEGCRESIIVWANHNDTILDGHTRYERCAEQDIPFKVRAITLPDRHAAMNWIIRNQLGRRNATEEQKAYLRGKWYLEEKQDHGGQTPSSVRIGQHAPSLSTAEKISKETGVDPRTVKHDADYAKAVDALGAKSPALKDAALAGTIPKIAIPALAEATKSELRKLERQEGTELRQAVREQVSKPLQCGQPKSSAKVWHEVTAALGILKNRIDAVHNCQPHGNNKRQIMGHLDAIEKILGEWRRVG